MMEQGIGRPFPEGLIDWAGHHGGGVKKPFEQSSGRPTGSQIKTPLVRRLECWVDDLVAGEDVPRALLLVGGPGNGKTDAVEGCIEYLDDKLGAGGTLLKAFADSYVVPGELPPRKVTVDLASLGCQLPQELQSTFELVQDATESDPRDGRRAEELLLEELVSLLDTDRKGLYVCCVNRGILAHAATIACEDDGFETEPLLTAITSAVTSGPKAVQCWPLEGFEHIAIWPMDVESLVSSSYAEGEEQTVAHQIFGVALDESRWTEPCDLGTGCPFCQNRKMLSRKKTLDALIQLLHYYELVSGKRWTFRDLFSLVSYLLVGESSETEIEGKYLSPCQWAAKQHQIAREARPDSVERIRAPYLLMSRLYYHRLFPLWPALAKGDHLKATRELLRDKANQHDGYVAARSFFRFMARSRDILTQAKGDLPNRVRHSLGELLDPATASGEEILFSDSKGQSFSVAEVEERFSLSVKDGLELVGKKLEKLEREVLIRLQYADEYLVEDNFSRNRAGQVRLLQNAVRQYASRLVKRSIGCREAVCRDAALFREYEEAPRSEERLDGVRRQLRRLLNDKDERFRAGLATTFGQPVAQRSRDVAMRLPTPVRVKIITREGESGRPMEPLPYLRVDRHYVPLTFELFRALKEVYAGLHDASLPAEIYSLLDRVKSLVSGQLVRDKQVLSDEPVILIGASADRVEYISGKFKFTRGELA
jgi:hypothetical protein